MRHLRQVINLSLPPALMSEFLVLEEICTLTWIQIVDLS